jgi:hypothetical protein
MKIADLIAKVVKATNPNERPSTSGGTELNAARRTTTKPREQNTTLGYSAHISANMPDHYHGHEELVDETHEFGGIRKTISTTVVQKLSDEDEIGSESSSTRQLKK